MSTALLTRRFFFFAFNVGLDIPLMDHAPPFIAMQKRLMACRQLSVRLYVGSPLLIGGEPWIETAHDDDTVSIVCRK